MSLVGDGRPGSRTAAADRTQGKGVKIKGSGIETECSCLKKGRGGKGKGLLKKIYVWGVQKKERLFGKG